MEENHTYEPLSMDKFEVTINVPGELEPVKVNRMHFNSDGLFVQESDNGKFNNINNERLLQKIKEDISKIELTFHDREDDAQTVVDVLNKWCELLAESLEEKHGNTFSEMFEIEDVDETTTNMIIKKPVDEMTDDEKSRVRDVLTECFGATDELLKKIGL